MKLSGYATLAMAAGILLVSGQSSTAATYPANFTEKVIGAGIISASGMAFTPDGRLFVGQQKGQIRLVKNDTLSLQNVLNLQSRTDYNTERGLTGIAVDPNFASNGYLYVYYTARLPTSHNRLSRFTVTGDLADTTETVLFDLPTLPTREGGAFTNQNVGSGTTTLAVWHMGGGLVFGNDGKIYLGIGEHEVTPQAQVTTSLWGKVLRLNADGTIPTDNPFYNTATGQNQAIYTYGMRNPYTMAVQRTTGKIFANDVGDGAWEEVDTIMAGKNYGWATCEGNNARGSTTNACTNTSFARPLFTYQHGSTTSRGNCVIGGGFTYAFRAQDSGKYFFADFPNTATITATNGWIKSVNPLNGADTATFATGINNMTGMAFNPINGAMYYITRGSNTGIIDTTSATSLTKGRVVKVSYDLTTGIREPARRDYRVMSGFLINLGATSIRVPDGVTGFQLFDLSGRMVWENNRLKTGESFQLPAPYQGTLKYRWIR